MVDVILPVLDEVAAIPSVLAGIPRDFDPIVVDNGSSDGSAACARRLGARVVEETQRGFGAACYAGLLASSADVVCFMDCDGSFRGADLERVVAPIESGEADLVLGARRPTTTGAWPWHARIANRALVAWLRHRAGLDLEDLGPMRAAARARLLDLGVEDRRFGWPLEMVVRAHRLDWRIIEIPVDYDPRVGRSKVTGTVRGTSRAVLDMSRVLR